MTKEQMKKDLMTAISKKMDEVAKEVIKKSNSNSEEEVEDEEDIPVSKKKTSKNKTTETETSDEKDFSEVKAEVTEMKKSISSLAETLSTFFKKVEMSNTDKQELIDSAKKSVLEKSKDYFKNELGIDPEKFDIDINVVEKKASSVTDDETNVSDKEDVTDGEEFEKEFDINSEEFHEEFSKLDESEKRKILNKAWSQVLN